MISPSLTCALEVVSRAFYEVPYTLWLSPFLELGESLTEFSCNKMNVCSEATTVYVKFSHQFFTAMHTKMFFPLAVSFCHWEMFCEFKCCSAMCWDLLPTEQSFLCIKAVCELFWAFSVFIRRKTSRVILL